MRGVSSTLYLILAMIGPNGRCEHVRPESVDLRTDFRERKLPPRHQGKRGACQVFAFLGVAEYHLSPPGRPVDLSEQFLMWSANEAKGLDRTEGFNPDLLIVGLQKHGVCVEKLMPYVATNTKIISPHPAARTDAASRRHICVETIKHWTRPIGFDKTVLAALRDCLDSGQPVTVTLCWPFGLPDNQIHDKQFFLLDRKVQADKNGHGVILVGYTRDASVPGGGYFLIRNAWGTTFADAGYAKVTFAFAIKYGIDAYRVTIRQPARP